jgi:hypothetical protein
VNKQQWWFPLQKKKTCFWPVPLYIISNEI